MNRLSGFSLLELLAVLLILGILAALAMPRSIRMVEQIHFQQLARDISGTLRYARLASVTKGQKVQVTLDEENPQALRLSGAVSEYREYGFREDDRLVLDPMEIVFYAESEATPGTVTLVRDKHIMKIFVDPLTARPISD